MCKLNEVAEQSGRASVASFHFLYENWVTCMASFADNNTARMFLEYTSRGIGHTMKVRMTEASTTSSGISVCTTLAEVLAELMLTTDSFTGLRRAEKGSDFSFPVAWTPIAGVNANASNEVDPESFQFSWTGRDATFGSRATWYFYGTRGAGSRPPTNRYEYGDFGLVDDVRDQIAVFAAHSTASFRICTASQGQPVVATYTNVRNNAYWQTEQR